MANKHYPKEARQTPTILEGCRAPSFARWAPAPIVILYKRLLPKTNVVTLAELLAGFGSKLGELTTAALVIVA